MKTESGATAIEYGLIVALIAVVIITAVTAVGTNLSSNSATSTPRSNLRRKVRLERGRDAQAPRPF